MRVRKRKGPGKKKTSDQVNRPLGGQFHPIHEIQEQDFLDGALVGAGSFKPLVGIYTTSYLLAGPTYL
jgi:hypothetical protein